MLKRLQKIDEIEHRMEKLLEYLEVRTALIDERLAALEKKILDDNDLKKLKKKLVLAEKKKRLEQKMRKYIISPVKGEIEEDMELIRKLASENEKDSANQ